MTTWTSRGASSALAARSGRTKASDERRERTTRERLRMAHRLGDLLPSILEDGVPALSALEQLLERLDGFVGVEVERAHASLVEDLAVEAEDVDPLGPGGVGLLGAAVDRVDRD